MKSSRRSFLITSIGVASTLALSRQAFADSPKVTEADPTAQALGYKQEARTAATAVSIRVRPPIRGAAARCSAASRSRPRAGAAHTTRRHEIAVRAVHRTCDAKALQHHSAVLHGGLSRRRPRHATDAFLLLENSFSDLCARLYSRHAPCRSRRAPQARLSACFSALRSDSCRH
jgi:hypothetical protein